MECSEFDSLTLEGKLFEGGDDTWISTFDLDSPEPTTNLPPISETEPTATIEFLEKEFCVPESTLQNFTPENIIKEALLDPSLIVNPDSTFQFTTDYEKLDIKNPYHGRPRHTRSARVGTMYKTKAKKVQPVDEADLIGDIPSGRDD
jgi:hypothetical protein